jgi:LacI family repressor for deo operon, udp, cdd, tsx, nupC, and nupG
MSSSHPTIRDVAARARVSHQTVSRVINSDPRVGVETRARVEAAIAKLGYHPNANARSMARGRTHVLACISPNLTDYTFAQLIEGAETEARQLGYFLLSASAPDTVAFTALIEQTLSARRADGLMVINPYADARHSLVPHNAPAVFVGARPRAVAVASVALDDEGAARAATRHLIDLGHRQIAVITGPLAEDCSQDRCAGYRAALEAAGIACDPALVIEGDWSASSGHGAVMRLSRSGRLPTAVFAQNDRMAMGVMRAARDLGLTVPQHLAVIGVDDMPLASYFDPPLTTMRQDMACIGQTAVRLLIQAIEDPAARPEHISLPAELVVRQSTGPGKRG